MNTYLLSKAIHLIAAFALVGPLLLVPRWMTLYRDATGRQVLHDLHVQTALAGWLILLSGGLMLHLQGGGLLNAPWMQLSIATYVLIQAFDHFWADKREDELATSTASAIQPLRTWLILKVSLYIAIAAAMVFKPYF